jgi:dTDP-4-dehydrorhamnose reductase
VHAISYAQRLGISFRCSPSRVKAISTAEYQTQAKRPLNSRLNTSKLTHMMGKSIPAWEQGVDGTIDQLLKEGFLT